MKTFMKLIRIEAYCNQYAAANKQSPFIAYDRLNPIVSTTSCFDDLRVDANHVSRRPSDTYYLTPDTVY